MTDAHCHVSGGDESVREFLIGRDFFGLHPWEVRDDSPFPEPWLRGELTAHPRAGVGEIGLDRLRSREISQSMRDAFVTQLELAREFGRPVVLHGAKCWGQVVAAIKNSKIQSPLLFHGFSRADGLIADIVALNGYISVGPAVLNDHAVNYRELVKKIPADRLLVETDRDCPAAEFLNSLTGQPLTIGEVMAKTAELRGMTFAELERLTDANASRFMARWEVGG